MPFALPWMTLDRFDDPSVPKLHNLKRAARARFEVPETVWARAADLGMIASERLPFDTPCIVRSGSPTEDTHTTSNAGQLLSVVVRHPDEFAEAVRKVVAALPSENGRPIGAVFVQPLIQAETAGVTFFDGFYYEETSAKGGNADLTQGLARGNVRRDHLRRHSPYDAWLARLQTLMGGSIDIEWAIAEGSDREVPVLLQVRPALFPIKRNEILSLANHKEILGDPPSPWMTGVLAEAGKTVMGFFAEIDPEIAAWKEPYAVEIAERAWMNFSVFFRLMDHWGMPRTMVTDGVGGSVEGPDDAKPILGRMARKLGTFVYKSIYDAMSMFSIKRGLRRISAELDTTITIADLYRVNIRALEFSIRTNFAIMSVLSVAVRLRRTLGLTQAARVVTREMMARYSELASRPTLADRLAGLDEWLALYGHRGPLESDPSHPRFSELRETLRADLARGPAPAPKRRPQPSRLRAAIGRPLFLTDEIREWFRDGLMRWWQRLRLRILDEARKAVASGHLDAVDDVFFLRGDDLDADPITWRDRVARRKRRVDEARHLDLPDTASRDEILAAIDRSRRGTNAPHASRDEFRGIGLGTGLVSGTAVRASTLGELLNGKPLPGTPILVASALEPSWAVVFPRFAAVVVELGGELSHASILLREAGIPAVINASGAFHEITSGDQICVDPIAGTVRIEARAITDQLIGQS
jgi:phosphohistidine swiveling domain-containing protein